VVGASGILFSLQTSNPLRGASMLTPTPTPNGVKQVGPASMADLQQIGQNVAATFKRQLASTGQATVADRLWFWYDLGFLDLPPGEISKGPSSSKPPARTRMWLFSTVVEGYQVNVTFVIGHPDGTTQKDWDAEARRDGPTFARFLERVSFARK
jgi:hypothetical protein